MNFRQAAGYTRRFRFLTRLTLPEGAQDLARNIPPKPYELVGPTVELVARQDLHPALSDLLISAAREVHSGPGMYPRRRHVSQPAGARLSHQRRRRALLQVGRAVPVQEAAVLAGQPGRPHAGRDRAAAGADRARHPAGADALSLAGALAHLPLVRRADGHRAGRAARRRRRARGDAREDPRAGSTRSRTRSTRSRRRCRSPTSCTSCASTSTWSAAGSRAGSTAPAGPVSSRRSPTARSERDEASQPAAAATARTLTEILFFQ